MTRFNPPLFTRHARKSSGRGMRGFTLVELLCVLAIMSIVMATTWSSLAGLMSGSSLTNNAYNLGGLVQQAKTAAMTQNTYVWLGFYSYTINGAPAVAVATVTSRSGLATDLQNNNYQILVHPLTLKNVVVAQSTDYLNKLPGVDTTNNTDVSQSAYPFTLNLPGQGIVTFSDVIAFSPDGSVNLPQSDGSLTLEQCVGVGLDASPSKTTKTVAVQIHGLSGQVSVFQQ